MIRPLSGLNREFCSRFSDYLVLSVLCPRSGRQPHPDGLEQLFQGVIDGGIQAIQRSRPLRREPIIPGSGVRPDVHGAWIRWNSFRYGTVIRYPSGGSRYAYVRAIRAKSDDCRWRCSINLLFSLPTQTPSVSRGMKSFLRSRTSVACFYL